MENVPPGTYLSRIFVVFSVLFVLTLLFAAASVAQTTSDPLEGETAVFEDTDSPADELVDRIVIRVDDCQAGASATVTAQDIDGESIVLNNTNATFRSEANQLTIDATNQNFGETLEVGDGEVVSSEGFTCGNIDPTTDPTDDRQDRTDDDRDDGGGGGGQYGNGDQGNADRQYGKPIIIKKTIVKGLPKTGGPTPLLLPFAAAFVVAGIAVVRRS